MRLGWIISVLSCAALCFGEGGLRVWRTQSGQRIEGRYVRVLLGKVQIETVEGKKEYISLDELSEWDKKHLSKIFIPDLTVDFTKKTQAKPRSRNALGTDYIDVVNCTVSIKTRDKIECRTLSVEVYLVGEEVATDDLRMMRKKSRPVELTEENGYAFQVELTVESRKYEEYNHQWRGCLYSGYAVVLRDQKGRIVEFETDLSWLQQEEIEKLRQFEEDDFFNEELKSRPVPRPEFSRSRVGVQ
jgi:hypothetical protein